MPLERGRRAPHLGIVAHQPFRADLLQVELAIKPEREIVVRRVDVVAEHAYRLAVAARRGKLQLRVVLYLVAQLVQAEQPIPLENEQHP